MFWTLDARRATVDFHLSDRRARIEVRDLAVIDTFQFFGPSDTPAVVDYAIEWRATGPAVPRGRGSEVPPTDKAAFLGRIAPASSTLWCRAEEFGFRFETDQPATSDQGGWAQIGRHRNGVYLDQR